MKTNAKLSLVALTCIALLFACKKSETEEAVLTADTASDTIAASTISSSAAVENAKSNRKFIRTADIKFKVKNVSKATEAIENAIVKFGGFVTYTNLQSNITEEEKTKISQDSTLTTTKYTVENNMVLRVPNTQLDTVIKTIAKQIGFLNHRVIKADDVSLQMLSNNIAKKRSAGSEARIAKAIDNKGKKLSQILDAEEILNAKKETNDNKTLENLSLQDQINFSTLILQIYQNQTIKQEMTANEKSVDTYRPHLGLQIKDSLKSGWFMLESLVAFVVQLWSLIFIGIVGFLLYKRYLKK